MSLVNTIPEQNKNSCGIYSITNVINGKKYIGSTMNFYKRFYQHNIKLNNNTHYNKHLQFAYNKYSNFIFELLEDCKWLCNPEDINNVEVYYIKHFNTTNAINGYNSESGGQSNKILSEEHKRKISVSNIGKKKSEEAVRKMTLTKTGVKLTEEHKQKISTASKNSQNSGRFINGHKNTEEVIRKVAMINTGKKRSEETKNKISLALMGNKNGLGHKVTEENKRKISIANKGNTYGIDTWFKNKQKEIK